MITIISGTNRPNSNSLRVAKFYQNLLKNKNIDCNILPLTSLPISIYSPDFYLNPNKEFNDLQELISKTQKFIFIIPEYNGSFPGVLKALIDVCKFPDSFDNKKCALLGIATGKYGNIRGVEHFTGIAHYCGMHVLPLKLHIPAIHNELNENGDFFNEKTLRFINEQVNKFVEF